MADSALNEEARRALYFSCLGSEVFAKEMGRLPALDLKHGALVALNLSEAETLAAASHHGDIGAAKGTMDSTAVGEQAKVLADAEELRQTLLTEGAAYNAKYGIKFMVSAKGKTGAELLAVLRARSTNSREEEWSNARAAIWEICQKRLADTPLWATRTQ